jgi:hypothetical protein
MMNRSKVSFLMVVSFVAGFILALATFGFADGVPSIDINGQELNLADPIQREIFYGKPAEIEKEWKCIEQDKLGKGWVMLECTNCPVGDVVQPRKLLLICPNCQCKGGN